MRWVQLSFLCKIDDLTETIYIFKGPLVVVALLYQLTGAFLGLVAKQFFWVPHRFRYGIIVAGAFGNVGDLRKLTTSRDVIF